MWLLPWKGQFSNHGPQRQPAVTNMPTATRAPNLIFGRDPIWNSDKSPHKRYFASHRVVTLRVVS